MDNLLVGADPELFVWDCSEGSFISGHNLIEGTKDKPFKVAGGAIQVDGTALEFNIDPASTKVEFIGNIIRVMDTLQRNVSLKSNALQLRPVPVAQFDEKYFHESIPTEAKRLGCEPDYNAYTGAENPIPDGEKTFRTGSGHVHIGWCDGADIRDPDHLDACRRVAIQMDYYLGIYSLYWDADDKRRELYGKAGAFRPKPYGLEYRSLSNSWLRDQALMGWVYDQVRAGLAALVDGEELYAAYGDLAARIINSGDRNWFDTYGDICDCGLPPKVEVF